MIYESYIYKDELKKMVNRMKKRLTQKRWTDHSLFLFEKDIFIAFYIIRKMIEAKTKISTKTTSMKVNLVQYMPTGKSPSVINDSSIDDLYAMNKPHKVTKDLTFLCNQIIHSYIFCPCIDIQPQNLYVLFNSFYERTKGLYHLSVADLILVLQRVSSDNPAFVKMKYNPEERDYEVWSSGTDEDKI